MLLNAAAFLQVLLEENGEKVEQFGLNHVLTFSKKKKNQSFERKVDYSCKKCTCRKYKYYINEGLF